MELPACPAHRAGVPGGGAEGAVFVHDKRVLSGAVGRVSREEMRAIDDALQVSLDIHIPEEMEAP